MDRKVCLVTGATSGLGMATARALAQDGLSVVVVGRNRDRCEQVAAEIERTTGNEVEWLLADLSVQSQIETPSAACPDNGWSHAFPLADISLL